MSANMLRIAYMFEFLIALIASLELWSQVGGQGHLDLMPWYTKLGLTVGMALVTVMGTASAAAHQQAWNAKTIACLVLALMLAAGMAGATYYYHLHENDDADDQGDVSVAFPLKSSPAQGPRR
jgi:hypothetical protein